MSDITFGLWITALGMGSVFGLLILLMVVLKAIGWSDQRTERRAEATAPPPAEPVPAPPPEGLSEDEIAAISVAVITHARIRRLQAAPAMRAHEPGSQLFASRWVSIGRGNQIQPWRRGN